MPTIGEKPVEVDEPQLNLDQSNSVAKGRTTDFLIPVYFLLFGPKPVKRTQ